MNVEKYRNIKGFQFDNTYHDLINLSKERLEIFIEMLKNNKNFTIAKFGDGEMLNMIATYEGERNCDGNNYFRGLGDELIRSYIYFLCNPNAYICKWHSQIYNIQKEMDNDFKYDSAKFIYYDILTHKIPFRQEQVNFFKTIQKSSRKKIYISHSGMTQALQPILNIDICINIPSVNCYLHINEILKTIRSFIDTNMIIMLSAGMCSKVIIAHLLSSHPENTFLDIGSTFDGLIRGSRDYNSISGYKEILLTTYL